MTLFGSLRLENEMLLRYRTINEPEQTADWLFRERVFSFFVSGRLDYPERG
jgi:hypothetical protein